MNVVYDCLTFFTDITNGGVIREGYSGYRIEEDEIHDNYYVVYVELDKGRDIKKRFKISFKDIEKFIKLEKVYQDFFMQQKFLLSMLNEVKEKVGDREIDEVELENICNDIYYRNENYLVFIALRMSVSDFIYWINEKFMRSELCLQ